MPYIAATDVQDFLGIDLQTTVSILIPDILISSMRGNWRILRWLRW